MIAGSIEAPGDGQDAMVARVKPNGKLDKNFGKKGITKFGVKDGTGLEAVTLANNGKIVVAGDTSGVVIGDKSSQLFARLTERGKLDKSFSGDGIFTRKVKGSSTRVEDVAIDKSGRILGVVGIFDSNSPGSTYGISAVKENGKKDKKFGKKGMALRDFGDDTQLQNIAIQKAGGIVVGGAVRTGDSISWSLASPRRASSTSRSASREPRITDFDGNGDLIQGLAIGRDDVIVAAGIGDGDFGFARYLENGAIDD